MGRGHETPDGGSSAAEVGGADRAGVSGAPWLSEGEVKLSETVEGIIRTKLIPKARERHTLRRTI